MKDHPKPLAVYAATAKGAVTAGRVAAGLPEATLHLPRRLADEYENAAGFDRLTEALTQSFRRFRGHVVVAASGVVIRAVAPLLIDKTVDPAVVTVDPHGRYAVSLLSGHLGGANDLARAVADILGGQAVITTATDAEGLPALEVLARERGLAVQDFAPLSAVSRALVEGRRVAVYDPRDRLWPDLTDWPSSFVKVDAPGEAGADPGVFVSLQGDGPPGWWVLRPKRLAVGLGCNRGTETAELHELLESVFAARNWSLLSIGRLATIDAKRDEPGLIALAERLERPLEFYTREELSGLAAPNPSATVKKHMGVESVCEAAAMKAADSGRLLATKTKSRNATAAVAEISFM